MFGLDVNILKKIQDVFQEFSNISKVIIYGSRAKENYRAGSDIDITLIGENLTLKNSVYPLMDKIDELNLPYLFDISIFEHINNKDLVEHINRVGQVFYQR